MNTTHRVTRSSALPSTVSAPSVIAILHDHDSVVRLNPLVISATDIPAPDHASAENKALPWKKVVDEISYLPAGMWKGSVEYEACFKDLENGVKASVWAPMGLTTSSAWTVAEEEVTGEGPRLVLKEECETRCSFLMMPFVKKTQSDAHETMIAHILKKLEGEGK